MAHLTRDTSVCGVPQTLAGKMMRPVWEMSGVHEGVRRADRLGKWSPRAPTKHRVTRRVSSHILACPTSEKQFIATVGVALDDQQIGVSHAQSNHLRQSACRSRTIRRRPSTRSLPTLQRRRAVELLVERILRTGIAKVLTTSHLQVDSNAGRFYEQLGFEYTGKRIGAHDLELRLTF